MKKLYVLIAIVVAFAGCAKKQEVKLLDSNNFKKEINGKQVDLYTLTNGFLTMQVTNYGGRVVSLWMPDKKGSYDDIVLGYESLDRYINNTGERFLGAPVGRYANRIANGTFTLDDVIYSLSKNDNGNTLHGGEIGIDRIIWDVNSVNDSAIVMHCIVPDGQDGFPGNLDIIMTYSLTSNNEFRVDYLATTDKPTVCNLSHHSFFNLKGEANGTILDNDLKIISRYYTPINDKLIPTGKFEAVKDKAVDFRRFVVIGDRINDDNQQIKNASGYDFNYVLDRKTDNEIELNAVLREQKSGRVMEVWSDQPALQFYSGNFFDGKTNGKYGKPHRYREALALETQKYPDGPNQPDFPNTILRPDEKYAQTCIYKFKVMKKK